MSEKGKLAQTLFQEGYNCCQSVVGAFGEAYGLNSKTVYMLSSPFGGGMGRLREVCGAVSGMFMVAGMEFGYDDPHSVDEKKELYEIVQKLAQEFTALNGSIICKELLGLATKKDDPTPSERTKTYYAKRPCGELVAIAAELVEAEIAKRRQMDEKMGV